MGQMAMENQSKDDHAVGMTITTAAPPSVAAIPGGGWRRAVQLVLGLLAFTLSMAMLMHAGQGAMPWDVLHQGLARTTGWSLGVVVAVASALVLAAWVPLRQRPGIGTLANVVVISATIGPFLHLVEQVVPRPGPTVSVALALGAIALNGVATAAYVGVHLGPGPRDGLLTGITARTGWSVRATKATIEVAVVAVGWALGGTVGWATVVFALGVGPVVQVATGWRFLVPSGSLSATRPRARPVRRPGNLRQSAVRRTVEVPAEASREGLADAPVEVQVGGPGRDELVTRRARRIARALAAVRAEHDRP
jgi:uncharacterized membrane protein YczE